MQVKTSHFGTIEIDDSQILCFPTGLPGFDNCQQWFLLVEPENPDFGWLQSIADADVAIPVVTPRTIAADHEVRVARGELISLGIRGAEDCHALAIMSKHDGEYTVNLRAPILINRRLRLGRQVIASGDAALRYPLLPEVEFLRKAA